MALMQALSRAELDLPFRTAKMYYLSVTAHGVLMALVFTTFFIMGFGKMSVQEHTVLLSEGHRFAHQVKRDREGRTGRQGNS